MLYRRCFLIGMTAVVVATACDSQVVNNLVGRESVNVTVQHKTLEWIDLMPSDDLDALLNPPDYISEVVEDSIEDKPASMLKSTIKQPADRYQQALVSARVRPELNGLDIRIAAYLVPLDFNEKREATSFFAVPFFGACIHVPPPPPNQIILVQSEQGVRIDDMYTPYWLTGELATELQENDMAESAYSMTLQGIEMYAEL